MQDFFNRFIKSICKINCIIHVKKTKTLIIIKIQFPYISRFIEDGFTI